MIWLRFLGMLLGWTLLTAGTSVAQSSPALAAVESAKHPRILAQLFPDSSVRKTWDRLVGCAGDSRDTSKTFEQIKFFVRDSVWLNGVLIKGEWVRPDTIYLTTGYEREGWYVAHELLHHMLNGPPVQRDDQGNIENPHVVAIGAFLGCGLFFEPGKGGASPLPVYPTGTTPTPK